MDIVALGTPFGLAFASGLNAYLPLLAFALSVRWLHLYTVNPHFAFITQTWFIVVLALLTLLDFVADKIPLIDHAWNASQSIIRPIAGAVVALAASNHVLTAIPGAIVPGHSASREALVALSTLSSVGIGTLIILVIGGGLAALSHSAKFTARIVSTLTTAGFLNGVLSLIEDGLVLIVILLSLFASTIMFILLIVLVVIFAQHILRTRKL